MTADLDVRLRRYDPADRNAVWQVHDRAARPSDLDFFPELNRQFRHVSEGYLGQGGEFLVGVVDAPPAEQTDYDRDGERVVGIGGIVPSTCETASVRETSSVTADDRTVELRSLRVDPDFRRQGVARRLVATLEERARDRGFERVVLDTGEQLSADRALYESLGYAQAGRESVSGFELRYYEKKLSGTRNTRGGESPEAHGALAAVRAGEHPEHSRR